MKKHITTILFLLSASFGFSQNVGIGTLIPDSNAELDITSYTKGLLIPRTSSVSRLAIVNPAKSLILYDTTTNSFWYHNGLVWTELSATGNSWSLTGNSGTDTAVNFLGTIDARPMRLRLNNTWGGLLDRVPGNYFIGDSSGIATLTGIKNIGIGSRTLLHNDGSWNTAVGTDALNANTLGNYNVGVGLLAMASNRTGGENTALGTQALLSNKDGWYNTATGTNSLFSHKGGFSNTANGAYALYNDTASYDNTAVGFLSLYANKSGAINTAIGSRSLGNSISGSYNTAVGYSALGNNRLSYFNTAVGAYSLAGDTAGSNNTAVGYYALYSNRANFNTGVGTYALYNDTLGTSNSVLGYAALFENKKGSFNTAIGQGALYNSNGNNNTGLGYGVLANNFTSSYNVVVGDSVLYNNNGAGLNTAVGTHALYNNTTGFNNIALGQNSGTAIGSPNTVNTISIGNYNILNAANNQAFFGNLNMVWNGGNTAWFTYSDARIKTNIAEDVKGLDFITRLRPVTYNRSTKAMLALTGNTDNTPDYPGKNDIEKIVFSGFLAQEVEQAAKASGYNFSGITVPKGPNELYTLSYEQFVVPLVKAVQEQQQIITEQNKKNALLEEQINALTKEVELIKAQLSKSVK